MIGQIADHINRAEALLVTAGAGMGVDSGLPDFRENEGFWKAYPLYKKLGLNLERAGQAAGLVRDPSFSWGFMGHKYELFQDTVPHQGYETLFKWARKLKRNYFVVTSNVDGHFLKAGFHKRNIWEIHGSYRYLQCTKPCQQTLWKWSGQNLQVDKATMQATSFPLCPRCNAPARPNVLMFSDVAWINSAADKQAKQYRAFLERNKDKHLVVLELGCGTSIHSLRTFGERLCWGGKGTLIRINPKDTDRPTSGFALPLGAAEGLSAIQKQMELIP